MRSNEGKIQQRLTLLPFFLVKNFFIQNNPLIISNIERQQVPIVSQEEKIKEEEQQQLKALPEVEIEDLKTPLNNKTGLKNTKKNFLKIFSRFLRGFFHFFRLAPKHNSLKHTIH